MRTLHNFLSIVLSIGLFTSCGKQLVGFRTRPHKFQQKRVSNLSPTLIIH